MIKISDLNIGPSEESALSAMRERHLSLSNNYELNTIGRINSAEFYNNEEAKKILCLFKQSESDKHLSYENILDRSEGDAQNYEMNDVESQRRS